MRGKGAGNPTKPRQTGPKPKKNNKASADPAQAAPPPSTEPVVTTSPPPATESPPPPGHNSEMSSDDRRYLIFRYRDKTHNRKERIASLTGEVRAEFKQAKAEGITKAEIEEAIKAKTPEGRLSMLARVQDIKFALEPYPEGTQFAMDFGPQPPEPTVVTAAREGRLAFDNEEAPTGGRWPPGSPENQAWLDNYQRKMAGRVRERIQPLKAGGPTPIETAIDAAGEAGGQAINQAIAAENLDPGTENTKRAIDYD